MGSGCFISIYLFLTRNLLPLQLQGNSHTCFVVEKRAFGQSARFASARAPPWSQEFLKTHLNSLCLNLLGGTSGKEPTWPMQEMWVQSLGQEDPLEEEMATHSSILTWEIPWTEEPGRL